MKKTLYRIGLFSAIISLGLLTTQCKKDTDSSTSYSNLSGKVTLADNTIADGAIVTLSTLPNAENITQKTIADATGAYSLTGIEDGTYYLNATFEPSNNNNLKSTNTTVILTGKEVEVEVSGNTTKDIAMVGEVSGGTANFKLADWTFDNTHSTIAFEFPYDAINAVFEGHFARAGFDALEFDEANPTATEIKAWVDITSVETGAPGLPGGHGRDGIEGCINGTLGLDLDPADTIGVYSLEGDLITDWPNDTLMEDYTGDLWGDASSTTYTNQSAVVGATGVATFNATEVSPYGTGYVAKGNFTLNGNTHEVTMYFTYVEGYIKDDGSKEYVSFYGWFEIDALNDFGIESSHVGDAMVKVVISAQFNKALV